MVTNQELNRGEKPGYKGVTADRKFYHVGGMFIKRTLRRHKWQEKTGIPMPGSEFSFQYQRGYVDGVLLVDLESEDDRRTVIKGVEKIIEKLHTMRSDAPGTPGSEYMFAPQRVANKPKPGLRGDFVFCHNNLSQQNVIVDPETLKIKGIID
ncbi:hypothetical protein PT974_05082 [Cladobotryum mycophilum]|uniref:Uncharacterized protein n=1 Tax=Cladobotryum mycophilum TaxID=491253 RepID=A0ABR0SQZ9_9HYPO